MGDYDLYVNAGGSITWLKRDREYEHYDTNYVSTLANAGVRFNNIFKVDSFSLDILTDAEFNYTGGDEKNLGSHKFSLGLNGGANLTFFNYLTLGGKIGVAYGWNFLNFGRGFPLEEENSFNLNEYAYLGARFCVSGTDVMPHVAYRHSDYFLAPEPFHSNELLFGVMIGGSCGEPKKVVEKEKPCPPCPTCPAPDGFSYRIYFKNKWPIMDLRPRIINGKTSNCYANSELDKIILMLWRWHDYLKAHPKITLELHVKGYANTTGGETYDAILAWGRSQSVVTYLTEQWPITKLLEYILRGPHEGRLGEMMKNLRANKNAYLCGAHGGLNTKDWGGILEVKNDLQFPEKQKVAIPRAFGENVNTNDPKFRTVTIRLEVLENGRPLTFNEFLLKMGETTETKDRKKEK